MMHESHHLDKFARTFLSCALALCMCVCLGDLSGCGAGGANSTSQSQSASDAQGSSDAASASSSSAAQAQLASPPAANSPDSAGIPYASAQDALNALATVTIAPPDGSAYNRSKQYGGFALIHGAWSVRDAVLDATDTNSTNDGGKFTSGTWYDPYSGTYITCNSATDVENKIEIDHIIPLKYVNEHGGAHWSQDEREEYANDYGIDSKGSAGNNGTYDYPNYDVLVAVDSAQNDDKGDKGPAEWLPQNKDYWYTYACKWIQIANGYGISITQADHDELESILTSG